MSYRSPAIEDEAGVLRDLSDRLRRLERQTSLSGTVGVGALRIGGFVIEVSGAGALQARRLSDDVTATILAGS